MSEKLCALRKIGGGMIKNATFTVGGTARTQTWNNLKPNTLYIFFASQINANNTNYSDGSNTGLDIIWAGGFGAGFLSQKAGCGGYLVIGKAQSDTVTISAPSGTNYRHYMWELS